MANVGSYSGGGYLSTNQSVGFGRSNRAYHTLSYVREEVGGGHLATRAGASVGAIGRVAAGWDRGSRGCGAHGVTGAAGARASVLGGVNYGDSVRAGEACTSINIVGDGANEVVHEGAALRGGRQRGGGCNVSTGSHI